MSAAGVALNGNPPLGHVVSYQFLKTGRYLVICMNRTHFLNDWMFGFVNIVVGDNRILPVTLDFSHVGRLTP